MPITAATVSQVKALWIDLAPMWEEDLAKIHHALESVEGWAEVRALQARATAIRAFLRLPRDLENKLTFAAQQAEQEKR